MGGRLLERFCHQPFVQQSATHNLQAPLVVSLGLLIAAAEYARLVFGNRDLYLQPIMNQVLLLTRTEGFTVSFSLMQLVVVYLSLVLIGLLLPGVPVRLVDGEAFSWYGSRLLHAPAYFSGVLRGWAV